MKYFTWMKHIFCSFLAFNLLSCATVGSYQKNCEKQYNTFPAVVACLKEKIKEDPRYGYSYDTDLVNLYISAADKLAVAVEEGKISEEDARLILAKIMVELKSQSIARNQVAMQNYLLMLLLTNSYANGANNYSATYVNGYYRNNGTYVQPYYRSKANGTSLDNWSTRGNINPYTGKIGSHNP